MVPGVPLSGGTGQPGQSGGGESERGREERKRDGDGERVGETERKRDGEILTNFVVKMICFCFVLFFNLGPFGSLRPVQDQEG